MTWTDALQVGLVVIGSLGGGGAIVYGLSGFLGQMWVQRLRGDLDAKLARLEATLEHGNFLLQRFAELELNAITACWQKARACLPLINAIRPHDSGTNKDLLTARAEELGDAHNELLEVLGQHEPFLPPAMAVAMDQIGRVVRLELSQIRTHKAFEGDWWEKGAKNQADVATLTGALLVLVKQRIAELRGIAEKPRA